MGSESPAGDGRGVTRTWRATSWEWNLDWDATYVPCVDCVNLTAGGTNRVFRGGGFYNPTTNQLVSFRGANDPSVRFDDVGIRCARAP